MARYDKTYYEPGWKSLATAIVELAVSDLIALFKYYKNNPDREKIVTTRSEYLFFQSEYLEILTDIDGDAVLSAVRRRVWGSD